jgi:hypothetical protein
MALVSKKILLIHHLPLPNDVTGIIKEYTFRKIRKIPWNDERYEIMRFIPLKEYDEIDDSIFLYLSISNDKDYFLVYRNFVLYVQVLQYINNVVLQLDAIICYIQ